VYKVPEFKISDFVESLPIKVKFLNSADSRPKHPDNAAVRLINKQFNQYIPRERLYCYAKVQ